MTATKFLVTAGSAKMVLQKPWFGPGPVVRWWINDKGLFHWEQESATSPSGFKGGTVEWPDIVKRLGALDRMRIKSSEDPRWSHENRQLSKYIEEMQELVAEAKRLCPVNLSRG